MLIKDSVLSIKLQYVNASLHECMTKADGMYFFNTFHIIIMVEELEEPMNQSRFAL